VKPGDRVAYTGGPLGAYSEARLIPAERLVGGHLDKGLMKLLLLLLALLLTKSQAGWRCKYPRVVFAKS
jgi:NADPH:quinone reductase-like Zn-dependent oxidoreductase